MTAAAISERRKEELKAIGGPAPAALCRVQEHKRQREREREGLIWPSCATPYIKRERECCRLLPAPWLLACYKNTERESASAACGPQFALPCPSFPPAPLFHLRADTHPITRSCPLFPLPPCCHLQGCKKLKKIINK